MIKAHGSASGKIILLGEHAVVHGAPALASGIHLGVRAEAEQLEPDAQSRLLLGGATVVADAASNDKLARAFAALLAEGTPAPAVEVRAESELPPGGGLGSSAALGVAIGRAVHALTAQILGDEAAPPGADLTRATVWERVFNGPNASNIDIIAAASGGCFRFTRPDRVRPIVVVRDLVLCVGWSGPRTSTCEELVEGLKRLLERKPELKSSIAGIAALVENATLAIEAGDLAGLGRLMDLNQMLLAGLMLSTESIETVCSLARENGALGAKLTGAGGGGSVIALVGPSEPDDPDAERAAERVLHAWKETGFSGFVARIRKRETRA
jgi:mevalonate kinase